MTEEEAHDAFRRIRWAENDGEPFCPHCGCLDIGHITTRSLYKCKCCHRQFSVTSGTIFASRKLPIRDYLLATAIFMNGAKGHSALQLSRDLNVQYKTAFVLAHKIREAMGSAQMAAGELRGVVEVDGGYFGGHIRPANYEDRVDRRLARHQAGKRKIVVVMRERGGRTLPFVFKSEAQGVEEVAKRVHISATIHADEAPHWDDLHARYLTKRINHQHAYSDGEACTNMAESFFSRLRRAEIGIHHHVSGRYLSSYSLEMAWREDQRRASNGQQF
jgi:transposase-like protein